MSIDHLQENIRKRKNPSVIDFNLLPEHIPPHIQERDSFFISAYEYYCTQLMEGMKEIVPAVRFSMSMMALYGPDGMVSLEKLLRTAKEMGYYVLLDCPDAKNPLDAQRTADLLFSETAPYAFDGLVISAYIGSDAIRPFCEGMKKNDKDLFVVVRTPNKTAQELQDLLTGSRHVHLAAADVISRYSEGFVSKCGYSRVAAIMAANAPGCLQTLRSKHKGMFILVDGYDYTNSNAKNCALAFDRLGYGAAVCAGTSITAAWQEDTMQQRQFVSLAVESAQRMKKNLTRYVTIL